MSAKEQAIADLKTILRLVESPLYPMSEKLHKDYATKIVQGIIDATVEEIGKIGDRAIRRGLPKGL